jgi:hypothetical protein
MLVARGLGRPTMPPNARCVARSAARITTAHARCGAPKSPLFYTLCETAKLVGVDPHAYLLHALYAAIAKPGAISYPEDLTPPPA